MKNEHFSKLKKIYITSVLMTSFFAILFMRLNLSQTSHEAIELFAKTNQKEIASYDFLSLASKLNALLASENIQCIYGKYKGNDFVRYSNGNCQSSFWISQVFLDTRAYSDLEISVSFKLPHSLIYSLICFIISQIIMSIYLLKVNKEKIILDEKLKEITLRISKQVAHDIRSPLSSLNMIVSTLSDLSEEKRVLIRSSINRINDIANELIGKSKDQNSKTTHTGNSDSADKMDLHVELIPALIDTIVSEKRVQYREQMNIEIEAVFSKSYGLFANVNPIELKRVVSNLVNNSCESFPDGKGKVVVEVTPTTTESSHESNTQNIDVYTLNNPHNSRQSFVTVAVRDNGLGIPENILKKLGEYGVSSGKENTHSGSGIGVFHAKQTVEKCGGIFIIETEANKGTSMIMKFPRIDAPSWFVEKLSLTANQTVISLDDDLSIHGIWRDRFKSLSVTNSGTNDFIVNHVTFTSGSEFKKYYELQIKNKIQSENILYLFDYELLNQKQTGLDISEELGIGAQTILITSRYEEDIVRTRCEKLKVKLIPKMMTNLVPIVTKKAKIKYDLVLIDDDSLIHMTWALMAKDRHLNIKMYLTPTAFLQAAPTIDQNTPVYIDVSLGNGVSGIEFSKQVHILGFTEINLATGYEVESLDKPDFIKKVCGKDFPDII